METLQFLKREGVNDLKYHFEKNLSHYLEGDKEYFTNYIHEKGYLQPSRFTVDDHIFSNLRVTEDDKSDDIHNAAALHEAMIDLPHYVAMDERLWSAMCHTVFFDFIMKKRKDVIEKLRKNPHNEGAFKSFKNSFFTHTTNPLRRGTFVNCISSLWWGADLVYDKSDKENPYSLLRTIAETGYPSTLVVLSSSTIMGKKETRMGYLKEIQALRDNGVKIVRDQVSWGIRDLNCIAGMSLLDLKSEDEIRATAHNYFQKVLNF